MDSPVEIFGTIGVNARIHPRIHPTQPGKNLHDDPLIRPEKIRAESCDNTADEKWEPTDDKNAHDQA